MSNAAETRKRWSDLFSFRTPRVESIQGLIGYSSRHHRDSQLTIVQDSQTEDLSSSPESGRHFTEQQDGEDTPEQDRITALPTVYMMDVYRPKSSSTANSNSSKGNRVSGVFSSIGRTLRGNRQRKSAQTASRNSDYDGVVLVPPSRQTVQRPSTPFLRSNYSDQRPGTPFPRSSYSDQRATLKKTKPASAAQSSTTVESKGSSESKARLGGICCGLFGSSSKKSAFRKQNQSAGENGSNGRVVGEMEEEEEMSFEDMLGTAPPSEAATLPTVPYREIGAVENDRRAGFGAGKEETR
jgi:hypothetical protein